MKKSGILLGIFIVIGSVTKVDAQCWIDKKVSKYDFETIGKARPNGGGINTIWIDKKVSKYDFETVGKIRPNSSGDDCSSPEIAAAAAYLLLLDEEAGN